MEEDIKTNPKEDWLVGFKHFILLNVLRGRGGDIRSEETLHQKVQSAFYS